ncbi:transcription-repair coupling factor [Chitinispirillales bacterium ANBcel5]|uniref:transcription-repair coupling factor n=1 Tax=Cellulosispirillum alkaliphilum TaxID=3039283 RepID=UPI002A515344|nr:transcription-repair coupling factor [Chitinispirillales bacterium ANBcel5]
MKIDNFSNIWNSGTLPQITEYLREKPETAFFNGLCGSCDAMVLSDLFIQSESSILVMVENSKKAETLAEECKTFLNTDQILVFPGRDSVPYNMKSPFGPTVEARYRVLSKLLNGEKTLIITPYTSLLQKIIPGRNLFNNTIRLESGVDLSISSLAKWLTDSGFHRENQVTDLGTFSIRGGIVDIYPFLAENPYRIEFWGDTVESIREFDVFSQKSRAPKKYIEIVPMKEFCFSAEQIDSAIEEMLSFAEVKNLNSAAVHKLEHQWKVVGDYEGIEWFFHWFDVKSSSILDYLPADAVIVWDDIVPLERRLDEGRQNYYRHLERSPELFKNFLSKPDNLLFFDEEIEEELSFYHQIFVDTLDFPPNSKEFSFSFSEQPNLQRELNPIVENIENFSKQGYRTIVLSANLGHAERFVELLGEETHTIETYIGFLSHGFISHTQKLLLYSENQIFNRTHKPIRSKKQKSGIPITSFDQLTPQDFVVHEEHGIGKFIGIERIQTADTASDCMVILYADQAKVYVPIEDFYKVQKYLGKESLAPSLSKLGSSSWEKLKTRTKEHLREMAKELIELYAKRQYLEGIQFALDNLWQKEFEDSFIYEETTDQLKAIKEVKEDMESSRPMDRLICGDVGFGKTEVAMRAAFKAVMSGYQVAILAPTTILAAQHLSTFSERMSPFPVKLAGLSRFQKAKEQKGTLQKLENGEIDIVIGTHRILSQDIKFKNLGLLIIDEEQRFGVKHKEKLKQFRYSVDVLSMTATPIPRTLHMSLIGARDLSIITTPPRNRLPIETTVAENHDELIKNAIENELERGGQIYFVNNRIQNIPLLQDKLEQLVPKAKIVSAHGQMQEQDLEIIMKEFIAGRFDILISTVIIENGLDIPNVNTIIVNRADTLGLSQLYQLRGRVGRSSEQAYAYFLTPSFKQVNDISLKRLRALEQYTDLGSGFQIAMRDLEIRGAGNILGTKQHGFIAAVGFELYCRLLKEAVAELQGNKPKVPQIETKLDISLEAYIPNEYISDGATRIAVYQELSSMKSSKEASEIEMSILDRFGPLPEPVKSLVTLMKIKTLAQICGCSKVVIKKDSTLILNIDGEEDVAKNRIKNFFEACSCNFEISYDKEIQLKTSLISDQTDVRAQEVLSILESTVSQVA